jgi:hypothetical protein
MKNAVGRDNTIGYSSIEGANNWILIDLKNHSIIHHSKTLQLLDSKGWNVPIHWKFEGSDVEERHGHC